MSALPKRAPRAHDDHDVDGRMGFLEHLDELRTRIIRSCLAIAAGMLLAFAFVGRLAAFVLGPTLRALPPGTSLIFTRPGEAFSFYFDVAFMAGVVLAAPVVAFQAWRFIAPGLYAREKRLVVPFVAMATLGTIGGALFSHYVLFPAMMAFFGAFDSPAMKFLPKVDETFELYKNLMLGMVAVFQIPTVVFFLARMRVVTARLLWRHFQYAILVIFIVAAVLTPSPDPWNQIAFATPMIALYLIGIVVAWLVAPRGDAPPAGRGDGAHLRLVFAATVIDQARKRR